MATSSFASPPAGHLISNEMRPPSVASSVQDDDIIWTEYLKVASVADARLVKDWTKVIDVLLVFVALFSAVLTAFIIRISDNFQPHPADVTNKILIAIYNHTMNASTPIDLEQFLRLDDSSKKMNIFQNWLLYTSLTISIMVAALAMAAKLWVVRYSREVTTSGPPHACAKRRQEVYDGFLAWRLEKCIDAMPLMAVIAVILFALFIHSSISVNQKDIGYFVGTIFHIGIAFLVVASFSAAFIPDSPFRSPFSDFINFLFRFLLDKPIPSIMSNQPVVHWRTIGVVLLSMILLGSGGYLVLKENYAYFPCLYFAIAGVFALMRKGKEEDMPPRRLGLPFWILLSSLTVCVLFVLSAYFSDRSDQLCIIFFALASILLALQGFIGIKMSETKPMTIEAGAVAWLLETSSNKEPAWFQKAVQIAGQSSNSRALLVEKLLPLLLPLITSEPNDGQRDLTGEQEGYINTLAILLDFNPKKNRFWRNEGSLKRPALPDELIDKLKELQDSGEKCSHKKGDDVVKWNDGTARCPNACVGDAVKHILQLHESERSQDVVDVGLKKQNMETV